MYKVLTTAEVKAAEKYAIESGLNEDILIENAAAAVYENITRKASKSAKILILIGGGNNGADGLSVCRKLFLGGYDATALLITNKFNDNCFARINALKYLRIKFLGNCDPESFALQDYDFIIDCMVGIGLKTELKGSAEVFARRLNEFKESKTTPYGKTTSFGKTKLYAKTMPYIISVDIPSGLNSDSGEAMGHAVIADETVTFSIKFGHLLSEGKNYVGKLVFADIGILQEGSGKVLCADDVLLPPRKQVSHKYHYGRVRIIGASKTMVGAAVLACESATAALKCGAGLVTLCVPQSVLPAFQNRVKESTLLVMPDIDGKILFDKDVLDQIMVKTSAIVIGMGMGENGEIIKIIHYLAHNFDGTLIIDADGLNALSKDKSVILGHKAKIILTPHVGELDRLVPPENCRDIVDGDDIIARTKKLATELNAVVAAKSATTIISDGKEVILNITGTPAMAKGGSGDLLAGMTAAFSARLTPLLAAATACYHLGKLFENAEKLYGSESVLASDVIIK